MPLIRQGAVLAALPGALCFVTLGLAACGPSRTPKTEDIVIDQLAYGRAPQDLHVGDSVRFVNHDIFQHSATAKDGSFDVDLKAGATGTATFTRPGVVDYYCRYHPNMTGEIPVAP